MPAKKRRKLPKESRKYDLRTREGRLQAATNGLFLLRDEIRRQLLSFNDELVRIELLITGRGNTGQPRIKHNGES